jgi:hypothetical protein
VYDTFDIVDPCVQLSACKTVAEFTRQLQSCYQKGDAATADPVKHGLKFPTGLLK